MGASIFPISNYGGSQYDINILVWKVNYKRPSHADQIREWGQRNLYIHAWCMPTCFLVFLEAYVKATTTVALSSLGTVDALTVVLHK